MQQLTERHRHYWQKNLRITGILLAIEVGIDPDIISNPHTLWLQHTHIQRQVLRATGQEGGRRRLPGAEAGVRIHSIICTRIGRGDGEACRQGRTVKDDIVAAWRQISEEIVAIGVGDGRGFCCV